MWNIDVLQVLCQRGNFVFLVAKTYQNLHHSAYRAQHSSKTAMLRLRSDLLMTWILRRLTVKVAALLVCYNDKTFSANLTTNFPIWWLCIWICAPTSHMPENGYLFIHLRQIRQLRVKYLVQGYKDARTLMRFEFEPTTLARIVCRAFKHWAKCIDG